MVGLCQDLLGELTVCKGEGKSLQIQTESIERSEEQSVSGVVGEKRSLAQRSKLWKSQGASRQVSGFIQRLHDDGMHQMLKGFS